MSEALLSLRVSGTPEHLRVVRSFVGAVGRILDGAESANDDLRLAVTELATIAVSPPCHHLTVEVLGDGSSFVIRVVPGEIGRLIPEQTVRILSALFTEWQTEDPWTLPVPASRDRTTPGPTDRA